MSTNYKESLPYDPAHQIIAQFLNLDPDLKPINLYKIASHLGIPVATFWRYCSGEARWPASVWLLTMAYLKSSGRPVDWNNVFDIYVQILEISADAKTQDLDAPRPDQAALAD